MSNACQYENDAERGLHSKAMHTLAEDLGMPEETVRSVYEEVLCRVKEGARIKDYLVVLVSRNVKNLLKTKW